MDRFDSKLISQFFLCRIFTSLSYGRSRGKKWKELSQDFYIRQVYSFCWYFLLTCILLDPVLFMTCRGTSYYLSVRSYLRHGLGMTSYFYLLLRDFFLNFFPLMSNENSGNLYNSFLYKNHLSGRNFITIDVFLIRFHFNLLIIEVLSFTLLSYNLLSRHLM